MASLDLWTLNSWYRSTAVQATYIRNIGNQRSYGVSRISLSPVDHDKGLGFRLLNMHMHVCIHKVKSLLTECAILNAYPAKIVWTPLNLLCIPDSGKLLREKTFPNFAVWRHGILWYSKKWAICKNVLYENRIFHQFAKVSPTKVSRYIVFL